MKVNTKNTFLAALALGLLLASIAGTAGAAFPGANGKIAFQSDREGAVFGRTGGEANEIVTRRKSCS